MPAPVPKRSRAAEQQLQATYTGSSNRFAETGRHSFRRNSAHSFGADSGTQNAAAVSIAPSSYGGTCEASARSSFAGGRPSKPCAQLKNAASDCCLLRQPSEPSVMSSLRDEAPGDETDVFTCDDLRRLFHSRRKPATAGSHADDGKESGVHDGTGSHLDLATLDKLLFSQTTGPRPGVQRHMPPDVASNAFHDGPCTRTSFSVFANHVEDERLISEQPLQLPLPASPSGASVSSRAPLATDRSKATGKHASSFLAPGAKRKGGGLEEPSQARANRWKAQRRQWLLKDPEYMEDSINDLRRSKVRFHFFKSQLTETELWENANLFSDYAVQVRRNSERRKKSGVPYSSSLPSLRAPDPFSCRQTSKGLIGAGPHGDKWAKEMRLLQKEIKGSLESLQQPEATELTSKEQKLASVSDIHRALGNAFQAVRAS